MLASPDQELVERQPLLPGLATALDPNALAKAVEMHGLMLPLNAEVAYTRFKPETSCLVAYRPAGESGAPLYYATAFRRDSGKLVKALKRNVAPTARGPGRVVLAEQAVEVCVFPNDDHMPVLIPLTDPKRQEEILDAVFSRMNGACSGTLSLLAYKPERRCVLQMESASGRKTVIRTYEKRGFEPALARALHFASRDHEGIQRLVGYDPHHRLLAVEWCEGSSLIEVLSSAGRKRFDLQQVGTLLADLHSENPRTLPEWDATDVVRRLDEIVRLMPALCPDLAGRAERIAREVSGAILAFEPCRATIHGDFDARQVIVRDDGVTFIDVDEAASGPPVIDIGNFIAHLRVGTAMGIADASAADDAIDALLRGYASRSVLPSSGDIRAATALALLLATHEPFRRHRPDWPDGVASVLSMVERELGVRE